MHRTLEQVVSLYVNSCWHSWCVEGENDEDNKDKALAVGTVTLVNKVDLFKRLKLMTCIKLYKRW